MLPTLTSRRHCLGLIAAHALLPLASQAHAADTVPPPELWPEIKAVWPEARRRGWAPMRFFGLHIYDAELWLPPSDKSAAGADDSPWPAQPLALSLTYARALSGERIADRSLTEMQRQGAISESEQTRWLALLRSALPDVKAGDRLTAITSSTVPGHTHLFANGQLRSTWADAELSRRFSGIWLSPKSSEPRLRQQLLGQA